MRTTLPSPPSLCVALTPLVSLRAAMGIDIKAGGRKATKKSGRTAPKSENLYLRLLVKLYRFLARRTDAKFNATILKRLNSSNTNKPQLSIKSLQKFASKEANAGKTLVVVGPVTDDVRVLEVPKLSVCALRFTNTARARIVAAGGECLTFDQFALRDPLGESAVMLKGSVSHREAAKHFGAPGATYLPPILMRFPPNLPLFPHTTKFALVGRPPPLMQARLTRTSSRTFAPRAASSRRRVVAVRLADTRTRLSSPTDETGVFSDQLAAWHSKCMVALVFVPRTRRAASVGLPCIAAAVFPH